MPPPGQRIALAQDAAFSFTYEHMLAGWRRAGAEILTFSPLADEAPPKDATPAGCRAAIPSCMAHGSPVPPASAPAWSPSRRTRPVHGECGGYMVLGRTLEDVDHKTHEMLALLKHCTSFARRKLNLGYRQASLLATSPLGPAGARLRGHEFHYATVTERGDDAPLVALADGQGNEMGPAGSRNGLVSGAFFHVIAME